MVKNQDLFECDAYWKFFDANLCDSKAGQVLEKMNNNTYEYVEFVLKKKYPKLFEREYQEGMETPILKFKDRIDLSVNFCKSFY